MMAQLGDIIQGTLWPIRSSEPVTTSQHFLGMPMRTSENVILAKDAVEDNLEQQHL